MSAQVSGSLHVSSILRTMAMAPPSRDRHLAARQLAGLDPRQFLANLQVAAASRSPHAIAALKADMYELDDIFHKLSRAGHDVSAAQRDFQMLQAFVSQIAPPSVAEKQRHPSHHRTSSSSAFVPSSSSPPSHSTIHIRPRPGSISTEPPHASTRKAPNQSSSRFAPGSSPSSTSSSSSSSSRNIKSTVLSPVPHRLTKPRRASAPTVPVTSSVSTKKVHFATHATVYTFTSEKGPTPAPTIVPPSRPACLPRVAGSFSADGRPRF